MREALLCLQAQECQDFEILLIAHKADEEHGKLIEEILEDQEEEFRKKIRFFRLNEGTRTTPLNYGFPMRGASMQLFLMMMIFFSQTG